MIGYPLDSHVTFVDGVPQYDRAVSSEPLRELIKRLFSDGVLPDVATNLLVQYVGTTRVSGVVNGDSSTYNVVVNPGFGICAGCLKLQENYYGLTLDISETSNPRIDTVVLRLNNNDAVRTCDFHIVQGTPAANPTAPTLTRNASIWEIGLANILKPSVVSTVNPVVVTDTRLDPTRCGVISSISEFDTSELFRQVQDAIPLYEDAFNTWFDTIKGQLSEDAAGNLQNQIGILSNLTTVNKDNLVDALNEIAGSPGAVRYNTAQTLTNQQKTQARTNIGAEASGAVNTHNSASNAHSGLFAKKEDKPTAVSGSGAVNFTCANNREYAYTGVTSLTMAGKAVECHGFITFGSSAPTINVSGFTASGGDNITEAAASEVWEFSVMPHNSGSYIIWKNWSAT